jgi:thiamine-phosphate pyrophosphorylase
VATHATSRVARASRAELLRGIYVILNEGPRLLELAHAVLDAGVRLLQYRSKHGIVTLRVRTLRELTRSYDALLILNDDWRAASELDCDGVHLGPDDAGFADVAAVRRALEDRLIGLSCGTLEEVRVANAADVDYLGIGSVYATLSKSDAGAAIGIETLAALASASRVPVAAIGGIGLTAIPQIRASGAAMAAVISAISEASRPRRAARELVDAWRR